MSFDSTGICAECGGYLDLGSLGVQIPAGHDLLPRSSAAGASAVTVSKVEELSSHDGQSLRETSSGYAAARPADTSTGSEAPTDVISRDALETDPAHHPMGCSTQMTATEGRIKTEAGAKRQEHLIDHTELSGAQSTSFGAADSDDTWMMTPATNLRVFAESSQSSVSVKAHKGKKRRRHATPDHTLSSSGDEEDQKSRSKRLRSAAAARALGAPGKHRLSSEGGEESGISDKDDQESMHDLSQSCGGDGVPPQCQRIVLAEPVACKDSSQSLTVVLTQNFKNQPKGGEFNRTSTSSEDEPGQRATLKRLRSGAVTRAPGRSLDEQRLSSENGEGSNASDDDEDSEEHFVNISSHAGGDKTNRSTADFLDLQAAHSDDEISAGASDEDSGSANEYQEDGWLVSDSEVIE